MSLELEEHSEQVKIRHQKLQEVLRKGDSPYKNGISFTHVAAELQSSYSSLSREELEKEAIACRVTGRVMTFRDFGKSCFVHIQDSTGLIQLFVQRDQLGVEPYTYFKKWDMGDLILAEGVLFKTKTGELSISCKALTLITKSLHPLPEKYHGIADVEMKYRQRYLDLIMSQQTRDTFRKRSQIVSEIRQFFIETGFMEVETPMMHPIAGGAVAKPFITHHNTLDMPLYLRIAPELYLKRLLVGGFEKVFEMNRSFRNEGISIKHNPEFTTIEFYQAYATYEDFMDLHEKLFQRLSLSITGSQQISYQGKKIDLSGRWERISVEDSILKYTSLKDKSVLRSEKVLREYGALKGIQMEQKSSVGDLLMRIFDEEVEPQLIQPTFVTGYPLDVSPLSRKNEKDPFLVDRFELYIYGREMANAFSELNDPIDQMERFKLQSSEGGIDFDYIKALEYGMPPAAGAGIGIDRLVMLLTDSASIRDVILFPLMRAIRS